MLSVFSAKKGESKRQGMKIPEIKIITLEQSKAVKSG